MKEILIKYIPCISLSDVIFLFRNVYLLTSRITIITLSWLTIFSEKKSVHGVLLLSWNERLSCRHIRWHVLLKYRWVPCKVPHSGNDIPKMKFIYEIHIACTCFADVYLHCFIAYIWWIFRSNTCTGYIDDHNEMS